MTFGGEVPARDELADAPARRRTDLVVVSYFNPADVRGGAEQVAWSEAEALAEARSVVFASASVPVAGAPFAQVRLGGWTRRIYQPPAEGRSASRLVAFHAISLFNPAVFLQALGSFRRLRPRVVHTHNLHALSPAIWLAARVSGARVVHTHHDLWILCERATMTRGDGLPCRETTAACVGCRALRPLKHAQARFLDGEIFPSRWLREKTGRRGAIVRGCPTGSADAASAAQRRAGPVVVAYIGALTPHKLGVLLDAYTRAVGDCASDALTLEIAGAGPLEAEVVEFARATRGVRYLGAIDATARDRLLGRADAVVIPSTCPENGPLVYYEALAAGVAVIGADIGGLSELVAVGNLLPVRPGDSAALAAALVSLVGDRGRLSRLRAAAMRGRLLFAPARVASATLAALQGTETDDPLDLLADAHGG